MTTSVMTDDSFSNITLKCVTKTLLYFEMESNSAKIDDSVKNWYDSIKSNVYELTTILLSTNVQSKCCNRTYKHDTTS